MGTISGTPRRYRGEKLPARPRVAVLANDAIGNFSVATPLLQMLRSELCASTIDYYGGTRTTELQQASDLMDWHCAMHGTNPSAVVAIIAERRNTVEYDLVINLEQTSMAAFAAAAICNGDTAVVGPCLGPGGRAALPFADDERGRLANDREWIAADLMARYPFLQTGFIGEIFCRLAYLEGRVPQHRVPVAQPAIAIPDVLIATSASLPEKLWPVEKWLHVLQPLNTAGITVGLIGAKPSAGRSWLGGDDEQRLVDSGLAEDLRGRLTLPQVAGALGQAKAVLTLDNGILHLATAVGAPTVGLFRHGIHRLWAPPGANLKVIVVDQGQPVSEIPVETVWQALDAVLDKP